MRNCAIDGKYQVMIHISHYLAISNPFVMLTFKTVDLENCGKKSQIIILAMMPGDGKCQPWQKMYPAFCI